MSSVARWRASPLKRFVLLPALLSSPLTAQQPDSTRRDSVTDTVASVPVERLRITERHFFTRALPAADTVRLYCSAPPCPPGTWTTTPSTPSDSAPVPPDTVTPPAVASCLDGGAPTVILSGPQTARYDKRASLPATTRIDARTAVWSAWAPSAGGAARPGAAANICWSGGRVLGSGNPASTSWSAYHDTYAYQPNGPGFVLEDVYAENVGDGIKWMDRADDWTARRIHLKDMHDDCVETDWVKGGRLEDALFEGCYVFLAVRPNSSVPSSHNGRTDTIHVTRVVAWMKPTPTVYSGVKPSTSAVFKTDDGSRSPRIRITDLVLRVDVKPGVGNACLNPNAQVTATNATVVWTGVGPYPCLPIPPGWTLTTDVGVYTRAADAMRARLQQPPPPVDSTPIPPDTVPPPPTDTTPLPPDTTPPPPAGASVSLLAVGDIADCGTPGDEATAILADQHPSATILTLGDNAYDDGSDADFTRCYQPTWGRHKARTRPSPGNHDYHTSNAAGYFAYYGAAAGPAGRGYYSFDLGAWHLISLNSEKPSTAQLDWLKADLATTTKRCVLAYWHHPRWSSSKHGSSTRMVAYWQALVLAGAEIVLTGHDHSYERFAPQNGSGAADPTGVRQFVVGTGGRGLYSIGTREPNSEAADGKTWGLLKLTLGASDYAWEFLPVAGKTFSDRGSGRCL